jgi:hypothetical protein
MSADDVSWWANWILVGALMVGVAATYAIVVSGNIKEANLKRELKEKDDALETYKLTVDGKVADAKREGIEAGKTAGDALVRAAGLEKEAATARLETEKLKQVVAWRTLSPDVRAKLDKVLASKPASVNLRYMDGDPEAMYLGVQMTEVLRKANWQVGPGSIKPNGVIFEYILPQEEANNPAAQTLREAFKAADIPFFVGNVPPSSGFNVTAMPGAPTLLIGSRLPAQFPK